jgi:hypothetical protein
MTIFVPNKIANRYTLNSVIYKKDYKRGLIMYMKIDKISYFGFKNKNTHTKFSGKVFKTEKIQ